MAAHLPAAAGPKPQPPPPPMRILEGLAASGLRALRYVQEVEDVGVVVANDLDPVAVAAIRRNAAFAGAAGAKVHAHRGDARTVMLRHEKCFDVVDLDPYGSPHQLLDSAVQAVGEGGMLCVTATDMAVLCGANPGSCYSKYASMPLHKPYGHEQGLRILLAAVETAAARAGRTLSYWCFTPGVALKELAARGLR